MPTILKFWHDLSVEKILAVISVSVLLCVGSIAVYDNIGRRDIPIKIRLDKNEDPFVRLKQVIPEEASIRNVRQINGSKNEYSMTINTRKQRKELLEWIKKNRYVEDANFHGIDK